MANLTKMAQNIFGSTAGVDQISKFGSLAAGAETFTTDPAQAQSLSQWLDGWYSAVIGGNAPTIQDMNAAFFVITYQLAYLVQKGIPEWDAATTYYTGSFANVAGVLYVSRTDSNLNNLVTDVTNWKKVGGNIMTTLGDLVYGATNGASTILSGNTDAVRKMLTQIGNGLGVSAAPAWVDPTMALKYYNEAGSSITDTDAIIKFETASFDPGSNYNPTTGIFTAPVTDVYQVSVNMTTITNLSSSNAWVLAVFKNGSTYELSAIKAGTGAPNTFQGVSVSGLVKMSAGDTLQINCSLQTTGSINLYATIHANQLSISKVGIQ